MIVGDTESDGLLDTATRVWCATFYDTETNKTIAFTDKNSPFDSLAKYITEYIDNNLDKTFVYQNGVNFDIPLLEKLVIGWKFKGELFDTLYASRILWPDRREGHSLASWGEEFGVLKPEHEDWSQFSEEMLHRNKEDVKIGTLLFEHIKKHLEDLHIYDPRITFDKFNDVLQMEQQVAQIIEQQARNGWLFDIPLAYKLVDELSIKIQAIEKELIPTLPIRVVRPSETVTKAFKDNGDITANALKWYLKHKANSDFTQDIGGDFSKVQFENMNLGSSNQVKDFLLDNGWVPSEYNYKKDGFNKPIRDKYGKLIKTSPKIPKKVEEWEELAITINNPSIKLLAEYNKSSHRKSQIEGLLSNVRPSDHRIEAQANSCGTNTTRMQHRIVVNIPKSDPKVFYGKEMRSLFICPENRILVGVDASALEARIEAHYIYPFDPEGAMELIEGDIHTKNSEIFQCTRSLAKNGKYALTYGCAPAKLASTLGKPSNKAEELYNAYWEGNPGLKELKEKVEDVYNKYGYILAIDGRPLTIRYKHALINTLFQSGGSIIMKKALILLAKKLEKVYTKKEYLIIGNFHDEIQIECNPEIANEIGRLGVESIKEAGEFFNTNVPFTGEYKSGCNWSFTH